MLCVSGFELYSRWVPLVYVTWARGEKGQLEKTVTVNNLVVKKPR